MRLGQNGSPPSLVGFKNGLFKVVLRDPKFLPGYFGGAHAATDTPLKLKG